MKQYWLKQSREKNVQQLSLISRRGIAMKYCPLIIQTLRITCVRYILNLISKTQQSLLIWIYSICQGMPLKIVIGRWNKKDDVKLDTPKYVLKRRIRRLKSSVIITHESICSDHDVRDPSRLHEKFVIVPADKASINYTFACNKCMYYGGILIEELELNPDTQWLNLTDIAAS